MMLSVRLLHLLLCPTLCFSFFFPPSNNNCGCTCTPQLTTCPPQPSCAIVAPCPTYYNTNSNYGTYQSSYQTGPVGPSLEWLPASPSPSSAFTGSSPASSYVPSPSSYIFPSSPSPSPYSSSYPSYPSPSSSSSSSSYAGSYDSSAYSTDSIIPTMSTAAENYPLQPSSYSSAHPQPSPQIPPSSYIDYSLPTLAPTMPLPPVAPPPPPVIPPLPPSDEELVRPPAMPYMEPAPTPEYRAYLATTYESSSGRHNGDTTYKHQTGHKITTEASGYSGMALNKRKALLKRMRNSQTMLSDLPRTKATCNSQKLANTMAKAIVNDVSVSKRMISAATELAFDGVKFDVFCAVGEFSYSIHSRKYCEVTSDKVTCFAFR